MDADPENECIDIDDTTASVPPLLETKPKLDGRDASRPALQISGSNSTVLSLWNIPPLMVQSGDTLTESTHSTSQSTLLLNPSDDSPPSSSSTHANNFNGVKLYVSPPASLSRRPKSSVQLSVPTVDLGEPPLPDRTDALGPAKNSGRRHSIAVEVAHPNLLNLEEYSSARLTSAKSFTDTENHQRQIENIRDYFEKIHVGHNATNIVLNNLETAVEIEQFEMTSPRRGMMWRIWYWILHLVVNVVSVTILCIGVLSMMTIGLKSIIPPEVWWFRAAIECVMCAFIMTWPPVLVKFVLHVQFSSMIHRYATIGMCALSFVYTATINILEFMRIIDTVSTPAMVIHTRQGVLFLFIFHVWLCGWMSRDRRAKVHFTPDTAAVETGTRTKKKDRKEYNLLPALDDENLCPDSPRPRRGSDTSVVTIREDSSVHSDTDADANKTTSIADFTAIAPRIPFYIFLTHALPFLFIPLYIYAIVPILEYAITSGDLFTVYVIRFVVHPVVTELIVSIARTVTVMSRNTVSQHVMYAMLCFPQTATVFGARLLINGVATQFDIVVLSAIACGIEIFAFATIHERHIVIRKFQKLVSKCMRTITPCCFNAKTSRPMSLVSGTESQTSPGLTRSHSGWELDILAKNSIESQRFTRLLVESTYTHLLYEYVAIVLIPFVYIVYFDAKPGSSISQTDLWSAIQLIGVQLAFEIVTDVIGVTILYFRNVNILVVRNRHDIFSFGMESMYFIYYFVAILVTVPMTAFMHNFASFTESNQLPK